MMSRRSVTGVLADFRWWLLGLTGVVAFALGCVGFASAPHVLDHPTWTDVAYSTLTLFTFTAPSQTNLPVSLDIARFLAPIVAAYAGFSALASLFRDRVQQMRIPLMRGHTVICGLGDVGGVFLRQLHQAGARVVVIEQDPANPRIELCRSMKIPVIVGDARLQRTLHAAGLHHAHRLLAVCSHDGVNTEIVAVARRLATDRPNRDLRCLARIGDPELCALLLIQEANLATDLSSLDFFSTDDITARLLVDDFPIDAGRGQPHIVVAHLDAVGARLVLYAARRWFEDRTDAAPLWVTVIDDHADERVRSLVDHYPALEHVCRFVRGSATVPEIHRLTAQHADTGAPPLTRGYVTAYCDEQALETGLMLRQHLVASVPLVIALSQTHEVARLINHVSTDRVLTNFDVFSTLERTCTIELVEGGPFGAIASAIHRRWRDEERAEDNPAPSWSETEEPREESSRAQARNIAVMLGTFGCAVAPLRDWGASDFTFTGEEIDMLAIAEHDRWMSERLQAGWRLGSTNTEQKTSPFLIPFDDLPTDIAERNRMFVRAIPDLLASVGLQVIRVHTS